MIFLTTTTVLYFNAVCACHRDKPKPCLSNLLCTLFNLLCTILCICILRYLARPPSVPFLMEGRTTLHKGHPKPNGSTLFCRCRLKCVRMMIYWIYGGILRTIPDWSLPSQRTFLSQKCCFFLGVCLIIPAVKWSGCGLESTRG